MAVRIIKIGDDRFGGSEVLERTIRAPRGFEAIGYDITTEGSVALYLQKLELSKSALKFQLWNAAGTHRTPGKIEVSLVCVPREWRGKVLRTEVSYKHHRGDIARNELSPIEGHKPVAWTMEWNGAARLRLLDIERSAHSWSFEFGRLPADIFDPPNDCRLSLVSFPANLPKYDDGLD